MKKIFTFFAAVALLAIFAPTARAYDFSYTYGGQTLYYNLIAGNAVVTYQNSSSPRYTNLNGALTIPETVTYNGTTYPVTYIDANAFYSCNGLTSVTIPNSVTTIGQNAFYYCSGLTSVAIGNSVTTIGQHAFYRCDHLTSVTIPSSVTSIGQDAFDIYYSIVDFYYTGDIVGWCFNSTSPIESPRPRYNLYINNSLVTNLVIPETVTSLVSTFRGCQSLTSVTIPNSVTSIGKDAFCGCYGLTSVTIPNSVTTIGNYAFYGCSGLTSLTIPNSVTSIGDYAFKHCTGLSSISNLATSIGKGAFSGCTGLTTLNISGYVDQGAFYGCTGLTTLTIDNFR